MAKIKVLEKQIAQLIAAGEVVERPASVVKELIENSIDAGATRIEIEIKNGGIRFLRITDNGCGIEREDVKIAFTRHATSKIKNHDDLYSIGTLGFRGEALASICGVSKIEMITRSEEESDGTRIVLHGGNQKFIEDVGCFTGTIILIKDLFFNTPARMKFLKKDVAEANAVSEVIDKLALSHPEISFKFIREGRETLNTPGDGKISSAIYSVYGKDFFEGMISVSYEYEGIKLSGYVSKPENAKPTRSSQNFFINGRYVKIKTASYAIKEAFEGNLMVGKHPYSVLYLNIPTATVDVNVHPTKTEVKFINDKPIFDCIYYGIKTALKSGIITPFMSNIREEKTVFSDYKSNLKFTSAESNISQKKIEPKAKYNFDFGFENQNFKNVSIEPNPLSNQQKREPNTEADEKVYFERDDSKRETNIFVQSSLQPQIPNLQIIGEVFKCYVIVQNGDNEIVLIDKHAAHERLIYEKLKASKEEISSQTLLMPITVRLEKQEHTAILENLNLLTKSGYELEDFGEGEVIVRGIPSYLPLTEVSNSICEISHNFLNKKNTAKTDILDWIYHNIACRAAVKAGKNSDYSEILNLIKNLMSNPELSTCPHGRPIYVVLEKSFFEKKFKRI